MKYIATLSGLLAAAAAFPAMVSSQISEDFIHSNLDLTDVQLEQ